MKNRPAYKLLAFLIIAFAFLAGCQPAYVKYRGTHHHDGKLVYINPGSLASFSVPEYPAAGTAEYSRDLDALHLWQNKRSAGQCAAAESQQFAYISEFFPEYKDFFDSLPGTDKEFLYRIYEDAHTVNSRVKAGYKRPRPFLEDPTLRPCPEVGEIPGYAYPSGHATMAAVFTRLMLAVDPGNAENIRKEGFQAGLNRIIAGVHHPTDIEAGTFLGEAVFDEFMKDGKFSGGVDRLRAEFLKYKEKTTAEKK